MGHVRVILLVGRTEVADTRRVGDYLLLRNYDLGLLNDHGSRGQRGVDRATDNGRSQKRRHPASAVPAMAMATSPAVATMKTTADRDAVVGIGALYTHAEGVGLGHTESH